MLKSYLLENYGYNEPIFLNDLKYRRIIWECSAPFGKETCGKLSVATGEILLMEGR